MAEGATEGEGVKEVEVKKIVHTYPLVKNSDMPEDMRIEAVELIVTACEKFLDNNEGAAKAIKEQFDKKFGAPFHIVVGEGYGFEISYEAKTLLYMFFAGNLAITAWKC